MWFGYVREVGIREGAKKEEAMEIFLLQAPPSF